LFIEINTNFGTVMKNINKLMSFLGNKNTIITFFTSYIFILLLQYERSVASVKLGEANMLLSLVFLYTIFNVVLIVISFIDIAIYSKWRQFCSQYTMYKLIRLLFYIYVFINFMFSLLCLIEVIRDVAGVRSYYFRDMYLYFLSPVINIFI
jgi:hypothetical protein